MPEIYLTNQFKSDLDNLPKEIKKSVTQTIEQFEKDPRHSGLNSKKAQHVPNRNIWRSRVTRDYRLLWEWHQGAIRLWRVGKHVTIDAIDFVRAVPRGESLYIRDPDTNAALLVNGVEADRDQPQPFNHVPLNILRLYGVPDEALDAVRSLSDEESIWDLPIPENVQWTLYSILSNPNWTLEDLLDSNLLLYRTTVNQLEGYCEGKIKQLMLNLNEEQQAYVEINTNGPLLIKGVAGSGKTTIGLYRANYLANQIEQSRRIFGEDSSILLLTYSETLTKALRQLYIELFGDLAHSITVQSYKNWMLEQLQKNGIWLNEAGWETRSKIISHAQNEVAQIHPQDSVVATRPFTYLLDEIDQVIRARSLATLREYQAVERVGRGIGLDRERHRPLVWEIYERYQQALDEQGLFDWADLARLVQKHCQPLPQFDVIIVDEAQDLPPSDLRLATRLIPNYSELRSLTLLADPAQSIYYRGIPWKEAGISIQGRTRILAKNFRNTQQILEAARHIVEGCDDLKAEGEYIPSTSSRRLGPKPIVVSYYSSSESNLYLANAIIKLCQTGKYRPGDIAVISRSKNLLTRYIQSFLQKQNILCRFHRDEDFHVLENEVKLITMHSAKGLEFPVVFLIGLSDQYIPYINQDSDIKLEDELQERKLFYVSMTRAAERLYLLHPQRNRSRFLRDLDESTIRHISC